MSLTVHLFWKAKYPPDFIFTLKLLLVEPQILKCKISMCVLLDCCSLDCSFCFCSARELWCIAYQMSNKAMGIIMFGLRFPDWQESDNQQKTQQLALNNYFKTSKVLSQICYPYFPTVDSVLIFYIPFRGRGFKCLYIRKPNLAGTQRTLAAAVESQSGHESAH